MARIDNEVKINYVDLCIYGYEELATSFAQENWGIRKILEFSERIVYPSLIGLGGTPNYGLNGAKSTKMAKGIRVPKIAEIGPELSFLADGLSLSVPNEFIPELLIEFHKDSMSKRLWKALKSLEDAVVECGHQKPADIEIRAIIASQIIKESMQTLNSAFYQIKRRKIQSNINLGVDITTKLMPVAVIASMFWSFFEQEYLEAILNGAQLTGIYTALKVYDKKVWSCPKFVVAIL